MAKTPSTHIFKSKYDNDMYNDIKRAHIKRAHIKRTHIKRTHTEVLCLTYVVLLC